MFHCFTVDPLSIGIPMGSDPAYSYTFMKLSGWVNLTRMAYSKQEKFVIFLGLSMI